MWYICTLEYYSVVNNAICNNMDWPRNGHTEWSKSDREREIVLYYIILLICGSKKNDTGKLNLKNRTRLTDSEKELRITMWDGQREGIVIFKMDNQLTTKDQEEI